MSEQMMRGPIALALCLAGAGGLLRADEKPHPLAAPQVTSLTNKSVKYAVPKEHFVVLRRGGVTATVVDNTTIDPPQRRQRAGRLSGVATLTHAEQSENLYNLVGLNFEHIHDGTLVAITLSRPTLKIRPRSGPRQQRPRRRPPNRIHAPLCYRPGR
jgi:hypothetical protein